MDYTKIRRGMIFWKQGEPIESKDDLSKNKAYPWVVVSSDERNSRYHVSIVPIFRMSNSPKFTNNYVKILFHSSPAYVICDTIQTINGSSLESSKYDGWITDETMDKISDCLRKSLSIEYSEKDIMSTPTFEEIENVIDRIISKKLLEVRSSIRRSEIDDVSIKICENLEALFDIDTHIKDDKNIEEHTDSKTYEEYSEQNVSNRSTKNKWTEESIVEFLHKCDSANKDDLYQLMQEYHFKNIKSMLQTRRTLAKKLDAMSTI